MSKSLPHSEESERALLASVLLSPQVIHQFGDLREEDFYLERHQLIWRAMWAVTQADSEIDLRTLQSELEDMGAFEQIGGFAYLAGLDLDLPDINRAEQYAEIVAERSTRRKLINGFVGITSAALGGLKSGECMARAEELVGQAGMDPSTGAGEPVSLEETCAAYDEPEQWEPLPGGLVGVTTGFADLDHVTYGLEGGKLYVCGGLTSNGKSVFAKDVAMAAAGSFVQRETGESVLIFSLEMPWADWRDRILSGESAGVNLRRIRTRNLGPAGSPLRTDLGTTVESVRGLPIWCDDRGGLTADQISATAARFAARRGSIGLIVVDYLQLMGYDGKEKNMARIFGSMAWRMKTLSKQLDAPVLLISQITDEDAKPKAEWKPHVNMLRYSREISQHADQVWFIHRPELYSDKEEFQGIGRLFVAKQRQGESNARITLAFLAEQTCFRNLAHQSQQMAAAAGGGTHGW